MRSPRFTEQSRGVYALQLDHLLLVPGGTARRQEPVLVVLLALDARRAHRVAAGSYACPRLPRTPDDDGLVSVAAREHDGAGVLALDDGRAVGRTHGTLALLVLEPSDEGHPDPLGRLRSRRTVDLIEPREVGAHPGVRNGVATRAPHGEDLACGGVLAGRFSEGDD